MLTNWGCFLPISAQFGRLHAEFDQIWAGFDQIWEAIDMGAEGLGQKHHRETQHACPAYSICMFQSVEIGGVPAGGPQTPASSLTVCQKEGLRFDRLCFAFQRALQRQRRGRGQRPRLRRAGPA